MTQRKLSAQESRIWEAAYAAAFVADFAETVRLHSEGRLLDRDEAAIDTFARASSAERPWHIADLAVHRFREWKREERRGRGPALGET